MNHLDYMFMEWAKRPSVKSPVQLMTYEERVAHFHKLLGYSDIWRARDLAREYR